MKILILTVALLFMVSGPVMAAEWEFDWKWNGQDYILQCFATGLNIIDWGQTRTISLNPNLYHETNPYLGLHPSVQQVNEYFIKQILGDILFTAFLPRITVYFKNGDYLEINFRVLNQLDTVLKEYCAVSNNYRIGIYPQF